MAYWCTDLGFTCQQGSSAAYANDYTCVCPPEKDNFGSYCAPKPPTPDPCGVTGNWTWDPQFFADTGDSANAWYCKCNVNYYERTNGLSPVNNRRYTTPCVSYCEYLAFLWNGDYASNICPRGERCVNGSEEFVYTCVPDS
ncbi:hypothetical protein HYH03_013489 [Edaphochlamys debaryana]|uniref:Uncharacterized protein n=1 Tax=Edaphochlamys debaryana TaxID=47281 RepID=A0A835XYB9_9CHLO|nr:hypothetical protein HYH03_013489 [Edaphochlamys debaryana]|eukprot:KAG2487909.1 hypothetical protein HYH03_013489 [Edaphochlamys debaryana]